MDRSIDSRDEINKQIETFAEDFKKVEAEIKKNIIGQQNTIRNVLCAMIAGGNVLLEGLPGLGKTKLVKVIGKTLDLSFSRIQFTPDLMPSDVTGTDVFMKDESGSNAFQFQKGPIFANLVLADEINRATPKTQSSLLEAMQEKTVTIGKSTYELPKPFFVLATQNPLEMEGTYPLPEAQMDRFLVKLDVECPKESELLEIVELTTGGKEEEPHKIFTAEKLHLMGKAAALVPISKAVGEYAISLVMMTHPENEKAHALSKKYLRYGSSPRGAQAIFTISKIYALLDGRYNVSYDDIKNAIFPTLRHRLFLNFEAISDNITPDYILEKLIEEEKA